jgi:Carboxypeptidase regulatory-like domain
MVKSVYLVLLSIISIVPSSHAFYQASGGSGTFIGTVLCADSAKPARFAIVRVTRITTAGEPFVSQTATTDYNGVFTLIGLPPGEYYVDPSYPGYVNHTNWSIPTDITGSNLGTTDYGRSRVLIAASRTSTLTIILTLGSSISGRVVYDDGSPGVSLRVEGVLLPDRGSELGRDFSSSKASFVSTTQTDDQGRFRISGLASGRYLIRVSFPVQGYRAWYLGNTSNVNLAQAVDLLDSEDYSTFNINLPVSPPLVPQAQSTYPPS